MAEFLRTQKVSSSIEDIIVESKKELVLISPYIKISRNLYERLKDASKRSVIIKIVYGKKELEYNQLEQLKEVKNLQLFYVEYLHAKCYFNEGSMVITSMNMYEYSEINNREMGVLIQKKEDPKLFSDALVEIDSIIGSSTQVILNKTSKNKQKSGSVKQNKREKPKGYCIRCHKKIQFNMDKPYCKSCYFDSNGFDSDYGYEEYGNFDDYDDYDKYDDEPIEEYCHQCGREEVVTPLEPLCSRCF